MTRITNADQVLLLLRSHLQRAQRSRKKEAAGTAKRGAARQGPVERVQQLAASEALSESDVARALIAGLLTEEFGAAVANDPHFQHMVDEVRAQIERDDDARGLMRRAMAQLG